MSDQQIIDLTMDGDVNAFGVIVERYQSPIFNLMLRMTKCDLTASELTQDAFVRAYEKIDNFKRGKRFFPWLYSISLNLSKDYLRQRKAKGELIAQFDNVECLWNENLLGDPQEKLLENQCNQMLKKNLSRLPDTNREAIILRYHEELSLQEVADVLGIGLSAAKMRIQRGLTALRNLLKDEPDVRKKQVG